METDDDGICRYAVVRKEGAAEDVGFVGTAA